MKFFPLGGRHSNVWFVSCRNTSSSSVHVLPMILLHKPLQESEAFKPFLVQNEKASKRKECYLLYNQSSRQSNLA
jgi:hypothetical protein